VEYEIDKKLGIKTRDDVLAMGIDKYNEECRSIVMRYASEWRSIVHRLGRWIDFDNDYKTLDPTFMESVWWVFKQLYEKGLVYRGYKVMPYSTSCTTPLSNFEAGQNYKDVSDPAVTVSFPMDDDPDNAELVAWTTTPWTLPSNLALCVNPEFDYVKVKDPESGRAYIVAECRLSEIPGAIPKASKKAKGKDGEQQQQQPKAGFQVLAKCKGSELVGKTYTPLFPYYSDLKQSGAFKVCGDGYVTSDSGTGIVHQAPAFGEDDYRVCLAHGVIAKGEIVPCPVDDSGRFVSPVDDFVGMHVKEADKELIKKVKELGRLVHQAVIVHSYPFCWRSDTPLIYRTVPSWFVKVEDIKDKLLANNNKTYWVPGYVKEKRFHNWLENARDWAISRSRFWGTPIPIWVSEDFEEIEVIGSIAELEAATGEKVTDIHRHFIDHLTIPSKKGKGVLRRIEDVFDCWFESGSMPYAQVHYPFENKEQFESGFPADFVAEGLDQTRGWFYTLMVLSTALFDKPPFKNLVCNGLVLAADGKKMSKRLKNYPDPMEVVNAYGADALRLYLINSPVVRAEPLKFKEEGVRNVIKDVFLPWYNAYRFLVQNVHRWEMENVGESFSPANVDIDSGTNILDRWICAATRSLTAFVRTEMEGFRLYTVVPYLVKFIDGLTNIYVRFNRKRLKGGRGKEDSEMALACLFDVLLTVCKVMAPFTPYLTEGMYLNLIKSLPPGSSPASVHFCDFPDFGAAHSGDKQIQTSVDRMVKVVDLSRQLRERNTRPVKTPIKKLTVVSSDDAFLADLLGELKEYVVDEVNSWEIEACNDPLKYATVRAEADFAVLGKRLGKQVGQVSAGLKALSQDQVLEFEKTGSITIAGVPLGPGDVRVVKDVKLPESTTADAKFDAAGVNEVLVVMDLTEDDDLRAAGLAREAVNRVQKMRKAAGLQPTDPVDFFISYTAAGPAAPDLAAALKAQQAYLSQVLGKPLLPIEMMGGAGGGGGDEICREDQVIGSGDDDKVEFEIVLVRPSSGVNGVAKQMDSASL
jgi:isoleucyl-tRNA synthetase